MKDSISFSNKCSINFSTFAVGFWRLHSWGFTTVQLIDFIEKCFELGIKTFDHADIYGDYSCEEIFGKSIAKKPSIRSKMQLVSKCGIKLVSEKRPNHKIKTYDTGSQHIIQSVENSLQMLQTDYLDVLLIHRSDPLMDADEIAEAFYKLGSGGKVRYFGVSNFLSAQFDLLQSRLDFPLITNQVEISVMNFDAFNNGILDQCQQYHIKPMAWSPLAGGQLFSAETAKAIRLRDTLNLIGTKYGSYSPDQVALAWLLQHPSGIVPVLGSGKIDRIEQAIESQMIKLSREDWFTIWTSSTGVEIP